jgi:hypothetical protein
LFIKIPKLHNLIFKNYYFQSTGIVGLAVAKAPREVSK